MNNTLLDRAFVLLLHLLPHHLLSRAIYYLTRCQWRPFKNRAIQAFIRLFKVDMGQARLGYAVDYASFNAFFTRELRRDARPLCGAGQLACPADGQLSAHGSIHADRMLQAKGMDYALQDLLGGDAHLAERFSDGQFATIYLSPRDYHRVHMPLDGRLRQMIHLPGRLFSVNAATARTLPRLFTRNERVLCLFDTDHGPMAIILVGAIFVGCMDTVWSGTVAPLGLRQDRWHYAAHPPEVTLAQGEEMGRFNMGSTVIMLFGKDVLDWQNQLHDNRPVRMGEALAQLRQPPNPA
jgi:phosphatidylserine decarboxylase